MSRRLLRRPNARTLVPQSLSLRPVALAVHLACIGGLVAAPLDAAQAQQAADIRTYDIPAGPLPAALTRFIGEAGISLSGTADLARDKNTRGLRGAYGAQDGLDALLEGTGLAAQPQPNGSYLLLRQNDGGEITLKSVKVSAAGLGETSEGTGSYTAGASRSATGLTLSLRETPQSVTVMTRARLDDQAITDISSVLDQTVGVTFNGTSSLGTDGVSFYARGFEIKNFQIDGTPRPPGIYGFSETTTDLVIYDRVEIVRGSTGLLNGAGSPSATVNLVRKRPTSEGKASITAQAGSYDHYRLEADAGGPLTTSGNVRGRLVVAAQESRSHQDRADLEKQIFYGILEADLTPNTLLTIGVEYQDFTNHAASRGGVPLFYSDGSRTHLSRSTNTGTDWADFSHQTTRLFTALEHRFGNGWSVKLDAEESRPDYDEVIGYLFAGNINRATGAGGRLYSSRWAGDLEQRLVSLMASGPFTLFGREHELMVGASHSTAEDSGDTYPGWWSGAAYSASAPNAYAIYATGDWPKPYLGADGGKYGGRITQDGAYAAVRLKPVESVSVILGSRVSNWKETEKYSNPSTLTKETGVVTPYAGIVVDLTEHLSAYASYTDIFDPQSNIDTTGSRLDPLEGASYEAGLKGEFNGGKLNASAAVFRTEQDNYPTAIEGAQQIRGKTPVNPKDAVAEGFETEVSGEALPGWQIGGGYARAKVKDGNGDVMLTEVPRDTVKLFTSYKLPGQWSALTVGGNLRWQGKVYTEDNLVGGDFVQDSLFLLDLMAKYAVTKNLSLALNANNVFDKEYYSGLSYSTGVYGSPRTFKLTARYNY